MLPRAPLGQHALSADLLVGTELAQVRSPTSNSGSGLPCRTLARAPLAPLRPLQTPPLAAAVLSREAALCCPAGEAVIGRPPASAEAVCPAAPRAELRRGRRARPAAKAVRLGPAHLRDEGMAKAATAWSTILAVVGGRTRKLLLKLGEKGHRGHLSTMLRKWSHRTALLHARHIMGFIAWHEANHSPWPRDEPMPDAEERLIEYMHHLVDAGAKATVLTSRLASLGYLNRVADLTAPLPVGKLSVTAAAAAHQRDGKRIKRRATVYTVPEVALLEKAAATSPKEMVRVVACAELRKLYGALRNDDATWDQIGKWSFEGGPDGVWMGTCVKTKATEATAARLPKGMPWVAPMRGISPAPLPWAATAQRDLANFGVNGGDEYTLPSPSNVRLGIKPPGATTGPEWQSNLTHALRAAGLTIQRSRAITLHSAKRTLLTWVGCSGIFSDLERQALGHHRSSGVGKTVRAYNVSELAGPVTKLRGLLKDIAHGKFQPDAPPGLQWPVEGSARSAVALSAPPAPQGGADSRSAITVQSGRQPGKATRSSASLSAQGHSRESFCHGVIFLSAPSVDARGLFFHAVTPASAAQDRDTKKKPKCVVHAPCGPVTNLCDFYMKAAQWAARPPPGYVACKVCAARSRCAPRPPPGPPPPGLVEDRRRRGCNSVEEGE